MDPRKVAVTLVCAAEDEAVLEPIVDQLRADNYEAELVSGVDHQPRRVGEALDRCGEIGLIVACTSERLRDAEMTKVEGMFSARRGPNHAIVRVDISTSAAELIPAILDAIETFAASLGSIVRRPSSESRRLREVTGVSSLALPVVRLAPDEELDGDTTRIQLVDNPKSAELSRRRRAARERERERDRITERSNSDRKSGPKPKATATPPPPSESATTDSAKLDRLMIVMIVGAGVLAVLAALTFSGAF